VAAHFPIGVGAPAAFDAAPRKGKGAWVARARAGAGEGDGGGDGGGEGDGGGPRATLWPADGSHAGTQSDTDRRSAEERRRLASIDGYVSIVRAPGCQRPRATAQSGRDLTTRTL
jgi:hypothetical protein